MFMAKGGKYQMERIQLAQAETGGGAWNGLRDLRSAIRLARTQGPWKMLEGNEAVRSLADLVYVNMLLIHPTQGHGQEKQLLLVGRRAELRGNVSGYKSGTSLIMSVGSRTSFPSTRVDVYLFTDRSPHKKQCQICIRSPDKIYQLMRKKTVLGERSKRTKLMITECSLCVWTASQHHKY